jgi:hypothetical protein
MLRSLITIIFDLRNPNVRKSEVNLSTFCTNLSSVRAAASWRICLKKLANALKRLKTDSFTDGNRP